MTTVRTAGTPLPTAGFTFDGAGDGGWTVVDGRVSEGVSELYVAAITLSTSGSAPHPETMLGEPAVLGIARDDATRRICGIVDSAEDLGHDGVRAIVRVTIVPALWALTQRRNSRIYQNVNAIEVVRDVLRDAGVYQAENARIEHLDEAQLPVREYCTQFDEPDMTFIARLLEDEGLVFYFEHTGGRETLVIADPTHPGAFADVPTLDGLAVTISTGQAGTLHTESIDGFNWLRQLQPTSVTLRDYNFTTPDAVADLTRAAPRGAGTRPIYRYPGGYTLSDYNAGTQTYRKHDGAHRADVEFAALASREKIATGSSNVTAFIPGGTFTLAGHGRAELDQKYILTHIEHLAHAPEAGAGANAHHSAHTPDRYRNHFNCAPTTAGYRPAHSTPRPYAAAAQTATVMPRPGSHEEISVDPYGRVLVQFHWDRMDLRNAAQRAMQTSCWVRVAQSWAGTQFGSVFTPRVGMEVVVQFLDGNPDRPLITGCVYNGTHRPPLRLPEEATRSTFKTNTSPGGGGFNELTFEDAARQEKIYLHAQRDLEEVVLNNQNTTIHVDRRLVVNRDRQSTIHRDDTEVVEGNQTVTIYKHGHITADESLTFECGSSKIVMYPNRVVITSPTIEIHADTTTDIKGGVVKINS